MIRFPLHRKWILQLIASKFQYQNFKDCFISINLNLLSFFLSKKNSTENCLYCGEFLDPAGIVLILSTSSAYVRCQKCGTKNFLGQIRKNPKPLPTPPVIKEPRFEFRKRKPVSYDEGTEIIYISSSEEETNDNRLPNRSSKGIIAFHLYNYHH
jgi:hypothetical protein